MRLSEYEDISKDKMKRILCLMDKSEDEMMRLDAMEIIMDGHLCRETAEKRIAAMKPTNLFFNDKVWHTDSKTPMLAYMESAGLTAQVCYEMVAKAAEEARGKAKEVNAEFYPIPDKTTIWDCYYAMAMVNSDFWLCYGNQKKLAELAYMHLSDPDR